MAGYSGTPLAQKLGIKTGNRVALVNAPENFAEELKPIPEDVEMVKSVKGKTLFQVILVFTKNRAELAKHFAPLAGRLNPSGGLWVAWPKKASGVATDLTENEVRTIGLKGGLVDNKVCAVDEVW